MCHVSTDQYIQYFIVYSKTSCIYPSDGKILLLIYQLNKFNFFCMWVFIFCILLLVFDFVSHKDLSSVDIYREIKR